MMYIKRPNHIGIPLGEVINYNFNKGHIKIKLINELNLGDSIAIGENSCKISELMQNNNNIKCAKSGQVVTIGRLKGKIKNGDKVYKTVSIKLNEQINQKLNKENIKRDINCLITLKENQNPVLKIIDDITKKEVQIVGETKVEKANNIGITKQRIEEQLSKTGNTIFKIKNIDIEMDENINISVSSLNELRRNALNELEEKLKQDIKRSKINFNVNVESNNTKSKKNVEVNLCLNQINNNIDYTTINGIDNIYIPFRFFLKKDFEQTIKKIIKKFNTYIILPAITKSNYENLIKNNLLEVSQNVKGIVISNLSQINIIKELKIEKELIANYTMNIENNFTVQTLKKYGILKYTVPAEAQKETIQNLSNSIKKEVIAYGRTLLMTTEYCTIGTFKNCPALCEKGEYFLKDRMGFEFPIYTDRINCNNLIYNSKITSISYEDLNVDSIRIDILEETKEQIQNIINTHNVGKRLEGQDYTNGNLNREI